MSAELVPGAEGDFNIQELLECPPEVALPADRLAAEAIGELRKGYMALISAHADQITGQNWILYSQMPDISSFDPEAFSRRRQTLVYAYKLQTETEPKIRILRQEDFVYDYLDGENRKQGTNYLVEDILIDGSNQARYYRGIVEADAQKLVYVDQLEVPFFYVADEELHLVGFTPSPPEDRLDMPDGEATAPAIALESYLYFDSTMKAVELARGVLADLSDAYPYMAGDERPDIRIDTRLL